MLGHAIYTLAVWLDQQGILPKLSAHANQLADQVGNCYYSLLQHFSCVLHLQSAFRVMLGIIASSMTRSHFPLSFIDTCACRRWPSAPGSTMP